jgi:hypothetical protein
MFEIFDLIYNGNGTVQGSSVTQTYPLTYTTGSGASYQNTAILTWVAQYGVKEYNEILRMQTQNSDGSWTDKQNAYEVYDNPNLVDVYEVAYKLMDSKYAAAGSEGQKLDQAQALVMKADSGDNNAVFMINGDWFLNEVKANYAKSLDQIEFMNVPVMSSIGVQVLGAGTKYGLDEATCDDVLSLVCKLVDENKSIDQIIAEVSSTFSITLDAADAQRMATARGTCFARGIEHLAFIPKGSTKANIAALALRMMASDDFAKTFITKANAASPYTNQVAVASSYKFVNQAQALVANQYFSPINSRVSNLKFNAMQSDWFLPHVANTDMTATLITENSSKSYRQLAEELVAAARAEAEKKWNNYTSKK